MPTIDLSASKPVVGTASDANLIRNAFDTIQAAVNALDNNNVAANAGINVSKLGQSAATSNQALIWTGAAWVPTTPPGAELDYKEFAASVSVTAATLGTANTVIASNAITYDGTAVWIEFWCYSASRGTTTTTLELFDGATDLGEMTIISGNLAAPVLVRRKFTPSAGSHTFTVKAYVDAGTGTVYAGAGGGASVKLPGYIRVTKA